MDPEARRRACVVFRAKLSRDTGLNLPAAVCEGLLDTTYEKCGGGEEVSLQSNPGQFYTCLGRVIADLELPSLVLPDNLKVALWCYREAAEVYTHPRGMHSLAWCYDNGQGVTKDPAQAAVWFQRAADLGDAHSKATLGSLFLYGDARAGVVKDAARGLTLFREAVDLGHDPALYHSAT
jgi:TPR repeat protein